ncbi:hypothetical protein Ana3638_18830 [Anaerocolumna sedimenticola]|uniref:Uncharacterized protein n=1 Tax=Anaerocolumna sedimenticola TaxID=2696063 RepID=A0A6P1TMZ0_9FIRM|nr:hypothetical protein [Anaerocolumna sedimenticola]QHQ62580.1 hypothetical protein Ana3638_18830 [Anaerocolumna sedimenticola]
MTTKKINTLIKEKLGKDITGQEAEGEIALPDGALGNVSGGMTFKCSKCGGQK